MAQRPVFPKISSLLSRAVSSFAKVPDDMPNTPGLVIPESNREEERRLEQELKRHLNPPGPTDILTSGAGVWPITGKTLKILSDIENTIYQAIPQAVPEAKKLPPRPRFLSTDQDIAGTYTNFDQKNHGLKAELLVVADVLLKNKNLTPEELQATLSHELAHPLIKANEDSPIPFVAPNPDAVREDLKKLGIPDDPKDQRYKDYMEDLQCDVIGTRINGAEAQLSSLAKVRILYEQGLPKEIQKIIHRQEQNIGHRLTSEQKTKMTADLIRQTEEEKRRDVHPSDAVRKEAILLTDSAMKQEREQAQNRPPVQGIHLAEPPTTASQTPSADSGKTKSPKNIH